MKKKYALVLVVLFAVTLLVAGCSGSAPAPAPPTTPTTPEPEKVAVEFVFLSNHEFFVRDDGLPGLQAHYGFEMPTAKITDTGITYTALADGLVDAAMGFATDGRIAGFNLVNLIDDKNYFPVYNPAPVVRKATLDKFPEAKDVLDKLGPKLDTATMTDMNYRVDIKKEEPAAVALEWLQKNGMVSGTPAQGKKGPISVGSKEFTEQLILGQIAILALRDAGFNVVDKTGLGGTLICREALVKGEIDLYWEYTGTAWLTFLKHDKPITISQEAYDKVAEQDLRENNLVWTNYAAFDNTYTVMMRKDRATELGIKSLSDLANYINQ
jgi:osmoprotectant transport system substrate-binding protein